MAKAKATKGKGNKTSPLTPAPETAVKDKVKTVVKHEIRPAPAGDAPARAVRSNSKPAFPNKKHEPSLAEFPARLPLAQGKRFEVLRAFLLKQPGVSEGFYFYGPRTGWGLRYLHQGKPLCALLIQGGRLVAVTSIDKATSSALEWTALSPVAQAMRKRALGSPSLLWLDLPLDGTGAADLKTIVRTKLALHASAREPARRS